MPLVAYDTPGVVRRPDMLCGTVIAGCSGMHGEEFVRYNLRYLTGEAISTTFVLVGKLDVPFSIPKQKLDLLCFRLL